MQVYFEEKLPDPGQRTPQTVLEDFSVNNAWVCSVRLNFQIVFLEVLLQVFREHDLSELAVSICQTGVVVLFVIEVIVVDRAGLIGARRNTDDSRIFPTVVLRTSDKLRHQEMGEKEVPQIIDCHL